MTREEFHQYISKPEELNQDTVSSLEDLVKDHSWFQAGRMLYVKNLHNLKSVHFDEQLSLASAFTPDGIRLYQLINKKPAKQPEPSLQVKPIATPPVIPPAATEENKTEINKPEPVTDLGFLEEEIQKAAKAAELSLELLKGAEEENIDVPVRETPIAGKKSSEAVAVDHNSSHSFATWLRLVSGKPADPSVEHKQQERSQKNDIISNFVLQDAAKAEKRPKAEFFSAEKMAQKSLKHDETLVSETLAKIYLRQGNLPKAQKAYEMLIVKHPEKYHIFAPLLEKIKNLREEQKNR